MIRIRKPTQPPEVLHKRGTQARALLCKAYEGDPESYRRGARHFEFDAGLYGHPQVKEALHTAQHGKCAFCESRISHVSYGDVEHFRPKAGWKQSKEQSLQHPGYYWLAYDWDNLFLSCERCNQQFKRCLFPLLTPRRRARSHQANVAGEAPVLIDPGKEDPEAFISFRGHVPYALEGNPRGEGTILVLGLHREALAEERRRHLEFVRFYMACVQRGGEEIEEARDFLRRAQQDDEPYVAMTRALLREEAPELLDEARRARRHSPPGGPSARCQRRRSRNSTRSRSK